MQTLTIGMYDWSWMHTKFNCGQSNKAPSLDGASFQNQRVNQKTLDHDKGSKEFPGCRPGSGVYDLIHESKVMKFCLCVIISAQMMIFFSTPSYVS